MSSVKGGTLLLLSTMVDDIIDRNNRMVSLELYEKLLFGTLGNQIKSLTFHNSLTNFIFIKAYRLDLVRDGGDSTSMARRGGDSKYCMLCYPVISIAHTLVLLSFQVILGFLSQTFRKNVFCNYY